MIRYQINKSFSYLTYTMKVQLSCNAPSIFQNGFDASDEASDVTNSSSESSRASKSATTGRQKAKGKAHKRKQKHFVLRRYEHKQLA